MLASFIKQQGLPASFAHNANQWFIPVAERLLSQRTTAPYFIAVNGCQGSGKSTLASFLQAYFAQVHQLTTAVISLDDFYLDQTARAELAEKTHPLLKTRGVPGTHDTQSLFDVLIKLKTRQTCSLPRFDKSQDNPYSADSWPTIENADIVILEGWCWGTQAQSNEALAHPCNTLESEFDSQGNWRRFVNQQLSTHYQPLYSMFDTWLMLKAPSFECVAQWRWQQEEHLARSITDKGQKNKLMSESEVAQFVQFFERLTRHTLETLPASCDFVFELDSSRQITQLRSAHA